jgi:hypothetical protein
MASKSVTLALPSARIIPQISPSRAYAAMARAASQFASGEGMVLTNLAPHPFREHKLFAVSAERLQIKLGELGGIDGVGEIDEWHVQSSKRPQLLFHVANVGPASSSNVNYLATLAMADLVVAVPPVLRGELVVSSDFQRHAQDATEKT